MCGLHVRVAVVPVVEWYRVSPGVKETTVFWIVQGNLTHQTVLCQVTTDPGTTSEVTLIKFSLNIHAEKKAGHVSVFFFFFFNLLSLCL